MPSVDVGFGGDVSEHRRLGRTKQGLWNVFWQTTGLALLAVLLALFPGRGRQGTAFSVSNFFNSAVTFAVSLAAAMVARRLGEATEDEVPPPENGEWTKVSGTFAAAVLAGAVAFSILLALDRWEWE